MICTLTLTVVLLLFHSATSQIIGGDSGMDVSEIYDELVVCQNNIPKTWLVLTPLQNVYSLVVGEIHFFQPTIVEVQR